MIQTIPRQLSSIDLCSVTNLERGSSKLWVHVVSLYVVTAIVLRVSGMGCRPLRFERTLYVVTAIVLRVRGMERGSSKVWVHVVSLYVVTAIVLRVSGVGF